MLHAFPIRPMLFRHNVYIWPLFHPANLIRMFAVFQNPFFLHKTRTNNPK